MFLSADVGVTSFVPRVARMREPASTARARDRDLEAAGLADGAPPTIAVPSRRSWSQWIARQRRVPRPTPTSRPTRVRPGSGPLPSCRIAKRGNRLPPDWEVLGLACRTGRWRSGCRPCAHRAPSAMFVRVLSRYDSRPARRCERRSPDAHPTASSWIGSCMR